MTSFHDLLRQQELDLPEITRHLDSLGSEERIRQVRDIPGKLQAPLFDAVRGYRALDLPAFVPTDCPDRQFVRHYGKNSLPLFSIFEKRFARPGPASPVLWGFNHGALMGIIGPGHFVMRSGPLPGELHVDYYSIPSEQLEGAPNLVENDVGISTLVYGNMIDVLRGVSEHVTIGRAVKKGKDTPNYFLLCREEHGTEQQPG
ncbi:MAG: hypothetical protein VX498_12530 [Myxococcota bacterium]|nr:hypothetical protein [Myxococcota bacterium]